MSLLSCELRAHVERLREAREIGQDKEIALGIGEWLEAHGKKSLGKDTLITKWSKLLRGDPEGEALLSHRDRIAAVAHVIRAEVDWLARLRDASRAVPTLVLDPLLPAEAADYLDRVAKDEAGQIWHYHVVKPNVSDLPMGQIRIQEPHHGYGDRVQGPPALLKQLSERLKNAATGEHLALIVLTVDRDEEYFQGAGVETTTLFKSHPPSRGGWRLHARPDLVPQPPSPEPRSIDEDGTPLVPHPDFASYYRHDARVIPDAARGKTLRERVEWAQAEAVPASFRPEEIGPWLIERRFGRDACIRWLGSRHPRQVSTDADTLWQIATDMGGPHTRDGDRIEPWTLVWRHGARVLAAGPRMPELEDLFEVAALRVEIADFARATEALRGRNPWRITPEDWAAVAGAVVRDTGIDVSDWPLRRRAHERPAPPGEGTVRLVRGDEAAAARHALDDLAARAYDGGFRTLPLRLEAATRAPLQRIERTRDDEFEVVANLGAGRLLRVLLRRYEDEPRADTCVHVAEERDPHRPAEEEYDGGDVHVWLWPEYDKLLEGSALPARERRREEEERPRPDDD